LGELTVPIDRRWNEEPVDSWYVALALSFSPHRPPHPSLCCVIRDGDDAFDAGFGPKRYRLTRDEDKQKSGRRISFSHKKKSKNPQLTELRLKIQYVRYAFTYTFCHRLVVLHSCPYIRYKRFISFFFEDSFLCATLLCFLSSDDKLAQALLALARSQVCDTHDVP
jgi:hypothetical protein